MSSVVSHIQPSAYQELRPYLFAVAYRMTGSAADADDLVQESWTRYLRAGSPPADSLRAWFTTTISRLAIDLLKSSPRTRETYGSAWIPEPIPTDQAAIDPSDIAEQREQLSIAMLFVAESLSAEQRVAWVLHESLGMTHVEIANHLDKSPAAVRQIVSRAKRRLQQEQLPSDPPETYPEVLSRVVDAFQRGDLHTLSSLLADDVQWVGDGGRQTLSLGRTVRGIDHVSRGLAGLARKFWNTEGVRVVEVNGYPAVVTYNDTGIDQVTVIHLVNGKITAVLGQRNPEKLGRIFPATTPQEG